jgi:hypothetical protein
MYWIVIGCFVWIAGLASAAAQNLAQQSAALKEIRDTAAEICYTVKQEGQQSDKELSGKVQAQLDGVIAKVVGLNIDGSGKLKTEQYQGVLQEQLASTLKQSADCRKGVFDKLVDLMLSPTAAAPAAALNIAGRWRDNWGTVYQIVQEGDAFRFSASGTSCKGNDYQSSGHGTITGRTVESSYNSTIPSGGRCSGAVFGNGTQMDSTCRDTICGSFTSSLVRQ